MSRSWIKEYDDNFEQDAWLGYEFWSAQVEAEMEAIERVEGDIAGIAAGMRGADAQSEGAADVLPF